MRKIVVLKENSALYVNNGQKKMNQGKQIEEKQLKKKEN